MFTETGNHAEDPIRWWEAALFLAALTCSAACVLFALIVFYLQVLA